jgi:hypothetical protein
MNKIRKYRYPDLEDKKIKELFLDSVQEYNCIPYETWFAGIPKVSVHRYLRNVHLWDVLQQMGAFKVSKYRYPNLEDEKTKGLFLVSVEEQKGIPYETWFPGIPKMSVHYYLRKVHLWEVLQQMGAIRIPKYTYPNLEDEKTRRLFLASVKEQKGIPYETWFPGIPKMSVCYYLRKVHLWEVIQKMKEDRRAGLLKAPDEPLSNKENV